jgi:TPR repeat protein
MNSKNPILFLVLLAVFAVQLAQGQTNDIAALKKKAEQGDPQAQNDLGVKYALGQGVPQDEAEAVKWYRKAAEQGDANAQFSLGAMYGIGQGVAKRGFCERRKAAPFISNISAPVLDQQHGMIDLWHN